MSIQQSELVSISCFGDGVTTQVTLDISKYLASLNTLPTGPSSIYSVTTVSDGPTIASWSLSGTLVTIVFSTVPISGQSFPLCISLLF